MLASLKWVSITSQPLTTPVVLAENGGFINNLLYSKYIEEYNITMHFNVSYDN